MNRILLPTMTCKVDLKSNECHVGIIPKRFLLATKHVVTGIIFVAACLLQFGLSAQSPTQQWITILNSANSNNDLINLDFGSKIPFVFNSSKTKLGLVYNTAGQPYTTALNTSDGSQVFSNVHATTATAKDLVFDGSDNLYTIAHSNTTTTDGFFRKFNSTGGLVFNNTINNADQDNLTSIQINSSNESVIYSCQKSNSNGYFSHSALAYNSAGSLLWSSTISDFDWYYGYATRMTMDANGNTILTGKRQTSQMAQNTYDISVRKINSSGTQLWQIYYDYNSLQDHITGRSLTTDSNGDVYFCSSNNNNLSGNTIRLVKLNGQNGSVLFQQQIGSAGVADLMVNSDGNLIVGGIDNQVRCYNPTTGALIWSATYSNINSISKDQNSNIYVTTTGGVYILNNQGVQQSTFSVTQAGYTINHLFTIAPTTNGEIYVEGYRTASGVSKIFVAKYKTCTNPPTLSVNSTTICSGANATLTATPSQNGGTFTWSTGATTSSITAAPTSTTSYTVTYNLGNCAPSTATGNVTVNTLPTATITAGGATTFCQGGTVLLSANTGTGFTYQWKNNGTNISAATGSTYSANASGSYTVVVTNSNGCSATSSATTITITPNETPTFSQVGPYLTGATIPNLPTTSLNGITGSWSPVMNNTTTTTYTFTPTTGQCATSATMLVTIENLSYLINPNTDGGFETGTTFATNGWSTAMTGNNLWYVGATVFNSGNQSAYISNNASAGSSLTYNKGTARVSHLYKDVTIPIGATNLNLSFNWLGVGELNKDYLSVYLVPSTTTPVAATALTSGMIAGPLNNQSSWQTSNIPISNSYAGSSSRLVFSWVNDNSSGTDPAAAIDNISLTYSAVACSGTPNSGLATISIASGCASAPFTLSASGLSSGSGISYQWQSSTSSSGPWMNISGATSYSFSTTTTLTSYYRVVSVCSGNTSTSSVVTYSVIPCSNSGCTPSYVPTTNLIGWWPFNGNAIDYSGSNRNGTNNGAVLTTDRFGNIGKAYQFSNYKYISVTEDETLKLHNTDFTISAWGYLTDTSTTNGGTNNYYTLLSKRQYASSEDNYLIGITNESTKAGKPAFAQGPSGVGNEVIAPNKVQLNQWVHIATTYSLSNQTLNLYVNGTLVNTQTGVTISNGSNSKNLWFGNDSNDSTLYMHGKVDDIGMWSVALTAPQISALYNGDTTNLYSSFFSTTLTGANSICVGQSATLAVNGGTGYNWSNGSTTSSITVSPIQTTQYSVTVTNSSGCTRVLTKTISVNSNPISAISGNDTICSGNSTTLTASGGMGTIRYLKFESTYSEDNGQVNVHGIQAYSNGTNVALSKPAVANSTNGSAASNAVDANFTGSRWSGNRNDAGPDSLNPHFIVVDLQNQYAVDSIRLNISNWKQTFKFKVSTDSVNWNIVGSGTNVSGTFSYMVNYNTYLWSTGSTSQSVTVSPILNTQYTVTVTNSSGCSSTANKLISVGLIATITASSSTTFCQGGSVVLNANTGSGYSFQWKKDGLAISAAVGSSYIVNSSGSYTVTITNSVGCSVTSASSVVTVTTSTAPTFTQVSPICSGETLSALPTTSTNGVTGTWSPALNNIATTTYIFTPTVGQCASTAMMTITVNPTTTPTFTQVSPICSGATLSALPTTSNNGITGTWSPALNNTVTTTYTFTPTAGQCASTATMTITVTPTPTVNAGTDVTIYAGNSTTLTATPSNIGGTFAWSNGLGTSSVASVSPTATTIYTVSYTLGSCVAVTDNVQVTVIADPTITATNDTICTGDATTIAISGSSGSSTALSGSLTNGLVGYWPFNGNANDASGNGNNGTVNGATLTTDRFGNADNSYSFNGINQKIIVPDNSTLSFPDENFSYSFWTKINPVITNGSGILCKYGITNNFEYAAIIYSSNSSITFGTWNLGGTCGPTGAGLNNSSPYHNTWHHMVFSSEGANGANLFIDGQLFNSGNYNSSCTMGNGSGSLYFGMGGGWNQQFYFNGDLDDIGIWNRALTQQEIQQLYSSSTYLWSNGATTASISVNPTTTTTYTCTVTTNGVSTVKSQTVVVNSAVTPTFTQVSPICSGVTLSALPTTSNNGITGTWLPALNNTATTNYTFTPTAGQCATTATLTITVNPNVTPTFTQVGPYLSGASIPALATTSTNGISGTWSPAISNTTTTTYTFTPSAGQCDTTTTMTITINQPMQYTLTANDSTVCAGTTVTLSVNVQQQITNCISNNNFNTNLNYGSTVDVDGNVYKTIIIGGREWFAENLRTTKYSNGDIINEVSSLNPDEQLLKNGAWSYYSDSSELNCSRGKLYNFYSVIDERGICPSGFKVASSYDWEQLVTAVGGPTNSVALMEVGSTHWINPHPSASNSSGFTAVPSGWIDGNGDMPSYIGHSSYAVWWTASFGTNTINQYTSQNFFSRSLGSSNGILNQFGDAGYRNLSSVRCVKTDLSVNHNPVLSPLIIDSVGLSTVYISSTILNNGGLPIRVRGIVVGLSPTVNLNTQYRTMDGSDIGQKYSIIDGLEPNTTYYARLYAGNDDNIVFGTPIQFTTP